jgi:hypothetical protein
MKETVLPAVKSGQDSFMQNMQGNMNIHTVRLFLEYDGK